MGSPPYRQYFGHVFQSTLWLLFQVSALTYPSRGVYSHHSGQAMVKVLMCSVDDVRAMIAGSGGPRSNGVTQAATVRLHDDKSTYTGARCCDGRRGLLGLR